MKTKKKDASLAMLMCNHRDSIQRGISICFGLGIDNLHLNRHSDHYSLSCFSKVTATKQQPVK